jgi:RNA polymerase sigma-70 factor (ECF subfamily)
MTSKMGMDEKEMVALVLKGDEAAQEELSRRFRQRLYATAVHFLGYQDPEAEDVLQDTLLAAFKELKGFEFRSGLYTWLNHICVNLCYARLRQRRKAVAQPGEMLELLSSSQALQRHTQAGEDQEQELRLSALRQELAAMKEGCRGIITLRDVEGRSYADIAQSLKVPVGTVMSRLARCRQALGERVRKALKEARHDRP